MIKTKSSEIKNDRIQGAENGAVLVISMLLLIVLTVIGIAAISTSNLDILLSSIHRQRQSVFYAAEAGLEHGRALMAGNLDNWQTQIAGATANNPVVIIPTRNFGNEGKFQYTVTLANNNDGGGPANDTDGVFVLQSFATAADGGRATVEIGIGQQASGVNTLTVSDQGQSAQYGGGSGKNFNSDDVGAVAVAGAGGGMNQQI
ncbi:MAG: hypothetical protein CSB33_03185 [Desulfobacterales bacterium]|nr:MAG: hypothetical protein CSB33_03185 [Desulfobacterales bacterium]